MTKSSAAPKSSAAEIPTHARALGFTREFLALATRRGTVRLAKSNPSDGGRFERRQTGRIGVPMFGKDGDEPGAGNTGAHRIRKDGDGARISPNHPLAQSKPARSIANSVPPHVIDVAKTLYVELSMCPHVLETFERIHNRHPSLPFADVVTAMRLIALFESEAKGHA